MSLGATMYHGYLYLCGTNVLNKYCIIVLTAGLIAGRSDGYFMSWNCLFVARNIYAELCQWILHVAVNIP
jgi:hypothetical protein